MALAMIWQASLSTKISIVVLLWLCTVFILSRPGPYDKYPQKSDGSGCLGCCTLIGLIVICLILMGLF